MATVRARGIDIYYEEYGEGPHLVVAHGLLGSVAVLPRFAERIQDIAARGVHVVAYDARGHGRSGYTASRADYHWASLAEDMYAFIRAVGIDRANIYGGSMGAGTALVLAIAHPDAVERLIVMSPPPFGDDMRRARRMFSGLALLYQLFGTHVAASVVTALPPARRLTTPDQRHDLRSFLSNQRRAAIVPAIRGLLTGPQIPLDRVGAITQPVIILTHPEDPIHPLASGTILRELMPHAKLAVAPSPTYWDEHPDELTRLVAAYVRGESIAETLPGASLDHARA